MKRRKVMSKNSVSEPVVKNSTIRAKEGETVCVLLNHVKAERREVFEHFMRDIIMPIVARTSPAVLDQTRVLFPTKPNEDGSYTYILLMDPLVTDGEYGLEPILKREYPPEKIDEYLRMFTDSLVAEQVEFVVTQSAW
jgi:hypothetical protein